MKSFRIFLIGLVVGYLICKYNLIEYLIFYTNELMTWFLTHDLPKNVNPQEDFVIFTVVDYFLYYIILPYLKFIDDYFLYVTSSLLFFMFIYFFPGGPPPPGAS